MAHTLSAFRNFPSALVVVAASALAFTSIVSSASPAYAAGSSDHRCTTLVDQARTAADSIDGGKQANAKRYIATGVKLCEAGNERAAAKQFRAVLKIAGVDEVEGDSRLAAR